MTSLKNFVKKEIVFVISFILAVMSAFFVKPSFKYFDYINWNVLFTLFSLMTIVSGLRFCGVFYECADLLCRKISSFRSIVITLISFCFFLSMFITNDVALLTFVPFSLLIINQLGKTKYAAYIIVLETAAANLGSMFTPLGNPQNLFLFNQMDISIIDFCLILFPYTLLSFVLLLIFSLFIPNKIVSVQQFKNQNLPNSQKSKKIFIYIGLFIFCLFSVVKIIPPMASALVTLIVIFIFDRATLKKVDYFLLLTFCSFFIFTGNIGNIQEIKKLLQLIVQNHEFITGLLSSQIISNVPAALLLEPFAQNQKNLLLGVNIGGLGTIVASLASLISFKLYCDDEALGKSSGKYMLIFTVVNIAFLIPLCVLFFIGVISSSSVGL